MGDSDGGHAQGLQAAEIRLRLTQQQLLLGPQHLLQPRLSLLLSTSPPIFCAAVIERLDPKPPFAFYEILHIPRHANQSQVKAAFYQQSKKHHPDVAGESPEAKDNFAALNLAYSVLRDPSQRYHYDIHGVSLEEFQKKEEENIYKWEPKYSVYTETQTVDGETTELEDWFTTLGWNSSLGSASTTFPGSGSSLSLAV